MTTGSKVIIPWKTSSIHDNVFVPHSNTIPLKCFDKNCNAVFNNDVDRIEHMSKGHNTSILKTKMDRVKDYFIQQKRVLNFDQSISEVLL